MATSDLHMHLLPYDYATDGRPTPPVCAQHGNLDPDRPGRGDELHLARQRRLSAWHADGRNDRARAAGRRARSARRTIRSSPPCACLATTRSPLATTISTTASPSSGTCCADAPFPVISPTCRCRGPEQTVPAARRSPLPFAILDRRVTDRDGQRPSAPDRPARLAAARDRSPGCTEAGRAARSATSSRPPGSWCPQLRALGADLVVVLAHSGHRRRHREPGWKTPWCRLPRSPGSTRSSPATRTRFSRRPGPWPGPVDPGTGRIHGTPVVAPGFWGSHLGHHRPDPRARSGPRSLAGGADARSEVRSVSRTSRNHARCAKRQPDRQIMRMLEPLHGEMINASQRPVGQTRRRLHSYFATAAPSPALDLVHRAMLWFGSRNRVIRLPNDIPLARFRPRPSRPAASAAPSSSPISRRDRSVPAHWRISTYTPTSCARSGSPALNCRDWLERAASVFNTVVAGQSPTNRCSPTAARPTASRRVAGCDYEIDLSAPPRYDAVGRQNRPFAQRGSATCARRGPAATTTTAFSCSPIPSGSPAAGLPAATGPRPHDRLVGRVRERHRGLSCAPLALTTRRPAQTGALPQWPARCKVLSSPRAREVIHEVSGRNFRSGECDPVRLPGFPPRALTCIAAACTYIRPREVGAGKRLANPVRSGRKQPQRAPLGSMSSLSPATLRTEIPAQVRSRAIRLASLCIAA